jgi:hypothetical protein
MKKIIFLITITILTSCEHLSCYTNNLGKLGQHVVVEGDTLQVIDVTNYHLYLSDGRKVDVHYSTLENSK